MDNLKNLQDTIVRDIDPNGPAGSILAQNHQNILKQVLEKVGKWSGAPFIAQKNATTFTPGTFSWQGNAMNNTSAFTIRTSKKTSDLNDFGLILGTLAVGDILHFKDFVGRSVFLEYQSHTNALDASGNPVWDITVKGFSSNPNYIYQDTETAIAVVSLNKTTGVSKTYVDEQDQIILQLAKDYADQIASGGSDSYSRVVEFVLNPVVGTMDADPKMDWWIDENHFTLTKRITFATADPSLDRIDLVVGNDQGDIVVITGTPDANPSKPSIDPATQIEGTFVLIKAGATSPDGITKSTIYDENTQVAGGEWDTTETTSGARINLASTVDFKSGTKSIEGTAVANNDRIRFTPSAPIPIADVPEIAWWFKNKTNQNDAGSFDVLLYGNKNGRSTATSLFRSDRDGYDPTSVDWQLLSAQTDPRTMDEITMVEVMIEASTADQFGFFMDLITYSGGTNNVTPEPTVTEISVRDTNDVEQFKITDKIQFGGVTFDAVNKRITVSGGGGTSSVENRYADTAGMIADQGSQTDKGIQYVGDATTDPTVDSGFAYYEYLGTTNGTLADYRKLSEQESMDVAGGTSGSDHVNGGDFTGVIDASGGKNVFYNDYIDDADPVVNLSLGANPVMGSQARVRIKGNLIGTIPSEWFMSGDEISKSTGELNELTFLFAKTGDFNVVNRVFALNHGAFETEYQDWLDYLSANGFELPSSTQQEKDNTIVKNLKKSGIWYELDVIRLFEAEYSPTSFAVNAYRVNFKNPGSFTMYADSEKEPEWISGKGFKVTGGSGDFAKTGWNPRDHAVNFQYENASQIFETFDVPTTFVSTSWVCGGRTDSTTDDQILIGNNADGSMLFRLNCGNNGVNVPQGEINGMYHVAREEGKITTIKDGLNVLDNTQGATLTVEPEMTNVEQVLFAFNSAGTITTSDSDIGLKFHLTGRALVDKRIDLYNILKGTY